MQELWTKLAARAGLALDQQQAALLGRYLDLLLEANRRMNLTRIRDRAAAEVQHVGDALTLLPFLPAGPHRLADVGSGGGVPGIPLAIVRPDVAVTLIESTQKKARFLRDAAGALGLANVTVIADRAENLAPGRFDAVVARAVAPLEDLVRWCLPLLRPGGRLLAMKGPRVNEELPAAIRACRKLGGGAPVVHPAPLPGAEDHVIVEVNRGPIPASSHR